MSDEIAATELNIEQAYEIAKSRGYGGSIKSFTETFARNEALFTKKYGIVRFKKQQGKTAPYFYRDIR